MGYDIIGDIHGHARTLEALLDTLGYSLDDGIYRHPKRTAIFLGDFIDRGPHQRGVLRIVRPMIDTGAALAVMGNHEFNAIAYATPRAGGGHLREHNAVNYQQHKAFLDAYEYTEDYHDVIDWFCLLPLWLDLPGLRVVHACWDAQAISQIARLHDRNGRLSNGLLYAACAAGNWEHKALETLLKGKEIPLPEGNSITDRDGVTRHHMRVRWWDNSITRYRDAYLGPENVTTQIPDDDIRGDHMVEYSHADVPVFIGHYWLNGIPRPLAPNIACLDYSVARPGGKLAAYRWDGEQKLNPSKFIAETALEYSLTEAI